MTIKCCKNCKPPKRRIGCHANCPDYLGERKQRDDELEIINQARRVEGDLIMVKQYSISRNVKKK